MSTNAGEAQFLSLADARAKIEAWRRQYNESRSLIASPLSRRPRPVSIARPGVTVLSAVGVGRRIIRLEALALQCPQRARGGYPSATQRLPAE